MRGANRVQGAYDKAVRLGLSDPEETTPEMLLATYRIMAAYDRYLYELRYDEAYLTRDDISNSSDLSGYLLTRRGMDAISADQGTEGACQGVMDRCRAAS